MSIRVSWVDDSRAALLRDFDGVWNWEDFYTSQEEAIAMLNSVEHVVNQIFDFSKTHSLPPNALSHLGNSARNMPDNRGASIVVTDSRFYQAMYRVLEVVIPVITKKVVLVKTREEALEKVHEIVAQS